MVLSERSTSTSLSSTPIHEDKSLPLNKRGVNSNYTILLGDLEERLVFEYNSILKAEVCSHDISEGNGRVGPRACLYMPMPH